MPEIIERWRACPLSSPPFVLPGDEVLLDGPRHRRPVGGFAEHIGSSSFGDAGPLLHLGLLPIPFVGDLRRASVFVLMLNPGLAPDDYFGEERVPEYRQAVVRNLRQELGDEEYPFFFLDPRHSWHSGFAYWHRRLHAILRIISTEAGMTYQQALGHLARSVCVIELVPYHSASFRMPSSLLGKLESVRLARQFVRQQLLPRAEAGYASIIVTRKASDWALQESEHVVVYRRGETRGASLGPGTRGGTLLLRQLRLS